MPSLPSRDDALALMHEYTASESLRKHMLAVEAAMRAYAVEYGEDPERWGLAGLIHDFDYERFPNASRSPNDEHPSAGVGILRERGWPEDILDAIMGHAAYTGTARETRMAKTLFAVDEKSPYYHEEKKGSIFYAESWALTHFIQMADFPQKAHRLSNYSALLAQNVDPVTAATRVFGDLKQLQTELENYVHQASFHYLKMNTTTEVDDSVFKAQALSPVDSEALRADFLAYEERLPDSQALLDHVLHEDSKNVSAHETKGYIAFRQGHLDEAKKWYGEAVQLDSQSYLAHYYFAMMSMNSGAGTSQQDQVESSLRTAIKLNPSFAPAYDMLAAFLGMHHKNLDEARLMALNAISLDPGNIRYRINVANVLLTMEKSQDAIQVLSVAAKLAKTPAESQMAADALTRAQEYADAQAKFAERQRQYTSEQDGNASVNLSDKTAEPIATLKRRPEFVPKGPHRFAVGVLKSVTCSNPGLDLTVPSKGKDLPLHVDNYYNVSFSALGFEPSQDLNPCTDLENRPAKVEYVESANSSVAAQIISVELHK